MLAWFVFWVVVAAITFGLAMFAIRNRHVHPGLILAGLDTFGLVVASYLSIVELSGGVPVCGPLEGCQEVANSEYARRSWLMLCSRSLFSMYSFWTASFRRAFSDSGRVSSSSIFDSSVARSGTTNMAGLPGDRASRPLSVRSMVCAFSSMAKKSAASISGIRRSRR